MRSEYVRHRQSLMIGILVALVLLAGIAGLIHNRRSVMTKDFKAFAEKQLADLFQFKIRIGGLRGNGLSSLSLIDVKLFEDDADESDPFFSADQVVVKYRLLDWVSQRYGSVVSVVVDSPKVKIRPRLKTQSEAPSTGKDIVRWCNRLGPYLSIEIKNGTLLWGLLSKEIGPIEGKVREGRFNFRVPVNHWVVAGYDLITTLQMEGTVLSRQGVMSIGRRLAGTARTEDTIVQFRPLEQESSFSFEATDERLIISSSDFFGGVSITGWISLTGSLEMDLKVDLNQLDFNRLSSLWGQSRGSDRGLLGGSLTLQGDGKEVHTTGSLVIKDGELGHVPFRSMTLHFEGNYPLVKLSDSGMVLNDESSIRFADDLVSFSELFDSEMYRQLAKRATQETFVWKGWQFSKPKGSEGEIEMQPTLGEDLKLIYKKITAEQAEGGQQPRTGVGVEYRLNSSNALKMEKSDVDDFFGIEHKFKF